MIRPPVHTALLLLPGVPLALGGMMVLVLWWFAARHIEAIASRQDAMP